MYEEAYKERSIPDERPFLHAYFDLVEHMTRMELRNTSKNLLLNYINESAEPSLIERAREAVRRYLQDDVPTLEEIQAKSRAGEELNELDHKILKMEFEARRFEENSRKHPER